MMTMTSCHDKLIHWLPDIDSIELTDEFQLVDNFTVHETSSQLSIRSLIPKFFRHIMSPCIQAHAEQWNSTSTRLSSRDFSILFHLPKLSIPQTENSLSTKVCEAAAANRSTAKTESWLSVCVWTTIIPEFQRLHSHHHTGWNISKVLICWLSLSLWLTWMHLLAGCQCL